MSDPRAWTEARWLVVDTEGNGYWPPDLVEVAVLPVTSGTIGEARSWLVKPPRRITPAMKGLHGITNTDVAAVTDGRTALRRQAVVGDGVAEGVSAGVGVTLGDSAAGGADVSGGSPAAGGAQAVSRARVTALRAPTPRRCMGVMP